MTSIRDKIVEARFRIALVATTMSLSLIGLVQAGTLNDSVTPIIAEVTKLFVPLLAVILAALPVVITMGILAFVLGLLAAILLKMKI